jgi:hypothetical protein
MCALHQEAFEIRCMLATIAARRLSSS